MYSDESAGDLTVTVEDETYQAETVVDLDEDGVADTAMVETDDGAIAFTDTDDDGRADLMTQLDADGDVIAQARFDESTGEWVQVDTAASREDDTAASREGDTDEAANAGTGPMTVDAAKGEVGVGAPTHDTDGDGTADSVVVRAPDGDTVIYTDADEDGDADYATEITSDGQVTIAEHTGDGDWTEIERGELDQHGDYQRHSPHTESGTVEERSWSATSQPDPAEVRIDPRTGNWIRG